MDVVNSTLAKTDNGATAVEKGQAPPNDDLGQTLRGELDSFWHEVNTLQREKKHINTTIVAYWLQMAEQALQEQPPRISYARQYLLNGRFWLSRAEECPSTFNWGVIAIGIELVYIILMWAGIYTYYAWISTHPNNVILGDMSSDWLMIVPLHVVAWGFLGGVAWCMYNGAFWTTRRLFDKHDLVWYIAHPWISAVLGSAVSLLFYAGLAGLTATEPQTLAFSATISVVSFVTGFSTKHFWQSLDRTIRKLFGETSDEKSMVEKASDELLQYAEGGWFPNL